MNAPDPKQVQLAVQLMRLGVSHAGVVDLLSHYDHDVIERQLALMPLRKAKRPSAFIVDAIRYDYSAPNPHPYASHQDFPLSPAPRLDEDSQLPSGSPHA